MLFFLPARKLSRYSIMFRCIPLRMALPILLAAAVLPLPAPAQSQDAQSQSVAEAARRAREQKKKSEKPEKPSKVITEDTLKPASGDPQTAAPPAQPKSAEATPASAAESGNSPGSSAAAAADSAPAEKSESGWPRPRRLSISCNANWPWIRILTTRMPTTLTIRRERPNLTRSNSKSSVNSRISSA